MSSQALSEMAGLFIDRLSEPTVIERMLDQGTTPEQRAAVEAERQATAARWQAARDELAAKVTPEFLEVLASAARFAGESNDCGDPMVNVLEIFELAKVTPPDLTYTDFSTPGYRDPRYDDKVDFTIQRPTGLPIVRCNDLWEGDPP